MGADPFQILGVSPNASEDEIRQAYRRLAKKYHPDLNPGDATAAQKMNEINAAYDAIKNPQAYRQQQAQQQARQQYEQQYQRSGQQQSDYDPFSDPFGFWGYQNGRQSGQNADQGNWQTWYTYRSGSDQDNASDAPGGYQWTYHRTHRRGGLFTRLIAIYLLIQVIAMLFGSCGYRSTYYDPYYYNNYSYGSSDTYSGQSQTDPSGTGSTGWY